MDKGGGRGTRKGEKERGKSEVNKVEKRDVLNPQCGV